MEPDVDEDPTPAAPTIRERMADLARTYQGKTANDPEYLQLIAPFESKARQIEMGKESSCGLALLGFYRLLGIVHELLERAYVDGKAPEWLMRIARDKGALKVAPFTSGSILLGDGVFVDGFSPNVHIYTAIAIGDSIDTAHDSSRAILSIDGGQRVKGIEAILQVKRTTRLVLGNITDVREDPPPVLARRVTHVIDLERLAA